MLRRLMLFLAVGVLVCCALVWGGCAAPPSAPGPAPPKPLEGRITDVEFFAALEGFGVQPHRYRMSATLDFSAPVTGRIVRATVNGDEIFLTDKRSRHPLIDTFDAERRHLGGEVLKQHSRVCVQFYHDWKTGRRYRVGVTVRSEDGETFSCESRALVAPKGGTYETPLPKFKVIAVRETAGLDRPGWPVVAGVVLDPSEVGDAATDMSLVQFDGAAREHVRVPFQVLAVSEPTYAAENVEASKGEPPKEHLFEICFLADLKADSTSGYLLYYGKPGAKLRRPAVTGPPLQYHDSPEGMLVDTGPAVFRFDPRSGQLSGYTPRLAGYGEECKFVQKERRPIHWNPDVWAPPSAWGHTSDWGLPGLSRPQVVATKGPLCFRTVRSGIMPRSNGTRASVSYTLFAGMPFILESSYLEFSASTTVNAVRTNELVFDRGDHTDAVWAERGDVSTTPCYDTADPHRFFGLVKTLDPDVPWLGFFHRQRGYGIAMVNLSRFGYSPGIASPQDSGAHYYFNDPGIFGTQPDNYGMNFTYLCRTYVRRSVVPKGTVFGEHSVFLVFKLGEREKKFEELKRWVKLLGTHPPKVEVRDGG